MTTEEQINALPFHGHSTDGDGEELIRRDEAAQVATEADRRLAAARDLLEQAADKLGVVVSPGFGELAAEIDEFLDSLA